VSGTTNRGINPAAHRVLALATAVENDPLGCSIRASLDPPGQGVRR
jgi:hypothetical protein